MKLTIAIAGAGAAESDGTSNYDAWEARMKGNANCVRIDKLDSNKMAAFDSLDNVLDTFVLDVAESPKSTDTLDSEQVGVPAEKTEHNVKVDMNVEKGA